MKPERKIIMNENELRVEGIFYLTMLEGETIEQARERFYKITMEAGIVVNDCASFEEQEI